MAMQGQNILPQKQVEAVAEARRESTSITGLVLVIGVLLAVAGAFVVMTAPLDQLLGEGSYAAVSAFHGLSAGVMMVVVTIGLYQAYQLFMGQLINLRDIKLLSVVNATMSFITIVFGNWIYIGYR